MTSGVNFAAPPRPSSPPTTKARGQRGEQDEQRQQGVRIDGAGQLRGERVGDEEKARHDAARQIREPSHEQEKGDRREGPGDGVGPPRGPEIGGRGHVAMLGVPRRRPAHVPPADGPERPPLHHLTDPEQVGGERRLVAIDDRVAPGGSQRIKHMTDRTRVIDPARLVSIERRVLAGDQQTGQGEREEPERDQGRRPARGL